MTQKHANNILSISAPIKLYGNVAHCLSLTGSTLCQLADVNNRLSHYHPAQSAPLLVKEGINQVLSLIRRGGGGVFVFFLFYFFLTNPANAGLILNHPNYTGLNAGLVGFWSFDGKDMAGVTAYDRSGQGNNGTLTNGPVRTLGKLGQALVFDGVNDFIAVPASGSISDLTTFTYSAWVYLNSLPTVNNGRIVSVGNTSAFTIFYVGTGGGMTFEAGRWTTDGRWILTDTSDFTVSNWVHVVVTYDYSSVANEAVLYTNGKSRAVTNTIEPVGSLSSETSGPVIGNNLPGLRPWNGLIDDVRIYNRALTGEEIKRLYNLGR